jgi:hypothetical protein
MNRSTQAAFVATYFFEGDKAPDLKVIIPKKGLMAEQAQLPRSSSNTTGGIIAGVLACSVISNIIVDWFWFTGRRLRQARRELQVERDRLTDVLAKLDDLKRRQEELKLDL